MSKAYKLTSPGFEETLIVTEEEWIPEEGERPRKVFRAVAQSTGIVSVSYDAEKAVSNVRERLEAEYRRLGKRIVPGVDRSVKLDKDNK